MRILQFEQESYTLQAIQTNRSGLLIFIRVSMCIQNEYQQYQRIYIGTRLQSYVLIPP